MDQEQHRPRLADHFVTRREFLCRSGMGMGAIGLASLLDMAGFSTSSARAEVDLISPLLPRSPHFPAKAKRMIHLFMQGGPSHVDTFDPKPALAKYEGKALKEIDKSITQSGAAFPSPFKFQKYGQSGIEVSEVFQNVAQHIDDIAVIRSMHTATPGHEFAMLLMNCGNERLARPSIGSWVTYGLGTENQNLPGFIVMYPHGRPLQGEQNWQSAFLPGVYQGNFVETRHTQVEKLIEFIRSTNTSLVEQRRQLDLLHQLEEEHNQKRQRESELETRIQSFETAYRMQMEATDAFDITREPEPIRKMYGDGAQGRQMLMARRLLERGVRFLQVWQDGWDHHSQVETGIRNLTKESDKATAALLTDLKQRGMLDDTLILWGGEFGRTPTVDMNQNVDQSKGKGRDHNSKGFSVWLAGGGVKGGYAHGATDPFGFAAAEDKVDVPDLHATLLHLLGFDHTQLTYRHAGRDFRLTDVRGEVVNELIA